MCDDYRAAIDFGFDLDAIGLDRNLDVPSLIMWGQDGAMDRAYDMNTVWKDRLLNLQTRAIPGGHFFPESSSEMTAEVFISFLNSFK